MARDPFFLAWREPRRWHRESMTATLEALRRGASPLLAVTTGAGKTDWTCHAAWLAAVESGGYHGAVILVPTEALVEQTYEALVRRATVDGARAPLFSAGRWYGRRKEAGADVVVCCYPSLPALVAEWAVTDRKPHLLIVDEAHGSEAETVRAAVASLGPRRMVGLTATPYRSGAGERLGLFSEVAYAYSYAEAVAEGVLVPRRIELWERDEAVDVDEAAWRMMEQHAPRREGRLWRTVVDADSIDDAEGYARQLLGRGVRAAAVHSQMPRAAVDARVEELRVHDLDVVVHCNLLSEGVDLPWLRCYALRNRTASRNRLVQRVGRVLRPDPGDPLKTHGLILDPWNLCRTVGLDHDAELGESEPAAPGEVVRDVRAWERLPPAERERRMVEALLDAERWVARLRLACEELGLCRPARIPPGMWRRKPVTAAQMGRLVGGGQRADGSTRKGLTWAARSLPESERGMVRAILGAPGLTSGVASDLIDILSGVAEARRRSGVARDRHWSAGVECEAPDGAQQVLTLAARAAVREGA